MKSIIIYTSVHYGNTKKVADVIARILDAELIDAREIKENLCRE